MLKTFDKFNFSGFIIFYFRLCTKSIAYEKD